MVKTGGHLIMQTTGVVEQSIRRGINEKTSLGWAKVARESLAKQQDCKMQSIFWNQQTINEIF